jgi:AbrB family looped-hinge helix DNA binding protein
MLIYRRQKMESARVGKGGAIIVPAKLRKRFGTHEGTVLITEARHDGILLRPAMPLEEYSPQRKAEFILSTATSPADYRRVRKEVKGLGIDPDAVLHRRPE